MSSKTRFIRKQILWVYLRTIVVGMLSSLGIGSSGCNSMARIEQDYQLPMNGKADQAKLQLEQLIKEDSTNAAAYYELSRTQYHMALANPRKIINGMKQAGQSIDKAMRYAPDNVVCCFFGGQVYLLQSYISRMGGEQNLKEKMAQTTALFEKALKLKPDYHEATLYLVELYASFPKTEEVIKQKRGNMLIT